MDEYPKVNICNVKVDNISFKDVLKAICEGVKNCIYITTPNVHHIILLQKDSEFRKVYQNASLALADGMPLIWAAKFLGTPLKEKISGSDLVPEICKLSERNGYKLFFLGGRPGAAQKAKENMEVKLPNIKIVGTYSPPFGFENDNEENYRIITKIRDAKPDILLVGLGAPKQEKWIYYHYKELEVPISIGVGVTFEFIAGMVKRAPNWMQSIGLEWFWRMMMEPRRLWRRYLVEDMNFFWLVLKQKFMQKSETDD